jgi:nucleoside-diphosphate-sugar epimerase
MISCCPAARRNRSSEDCRLTVLLTGASGFVGMNVLERLVDVGLPVVALSNRDLPAPSTAFGDKVVFVMGDVRDRDGIEGIMRRHRVDRVIHGAAITSDIGRERTHGDEVVAVNTGGTAAVASAAARCGVARFVLVGSIAVYGSTETAGARNGAVPKPALFTEDLPHAPLTLYDTSKSASELIVRRIAELNGMAWNVGRLGVVFGPWERATGFRDTLSPIHQVIRIAASGGRALLPRPTVTNWHYSRDAARSLVTLLTADAPKHHIYNLGPASSWSLADWCERLAGRFPRFSFGIGTGEGTPIDVYEAEDGPFLSWERFTGEFGPTAAYGLGEAFTDYLGWLDRCDGGGFSR